MATTQLYADAPPSTRVIVLTTFDIDSHVYEALRAGASGFLLKNAPPEDLVDAIRIVASGAGLLDLVVTRRVIEEFARIPAPLPATPQLATLTARELEVLHLGAQGLSNAEVQLTKLKSFNFVPAYPAEATFAISGRPDMIRISWTLSCRIRSPRETRRENFGHIGK